MILSLKKLTKQLRQSNIIFKVLISEKTTDHWLLCTSHDLCWMQWNPFTAKAELSRHVDEPASVCRIISVSVFSHSQNGHFDLLYRTRRTSPHIWVWHRQSVWEDNSQRCWSTFHQRVSVPDESDWIIFGDERGAPAGRGGCQPIWPLSTAATGWKQIK